MSTRSKTIAVLITAISCYLVWGFLTRPPAPAVRHAVWVQSLYFRGVQPSTRELLTDAHLVQLANTFVANGIRDAYMFAGPDNEDGTVPNYAFSDTAIATVKRLRTLAPQVRILPWLGGLQDKTVFLNNPTWRTRAIENTVKLATALGVVGVHLDFEYILPESTYVIEEQGIQGPRSPVSEYHPSMREFFRELKVRAPSLFISTVFPSSAPEVTPWKANPRRADLLSIAPFVSQVSFLYYDTSIRTQAVFEAGLTHQLEDSNAVRRSSPQTELLIAFGSFVNVAPLQPFRDLAIESIPNSFMTLRRVLERMEFKESPVDAIAIFSDWETSPEEWRQFRKGVAMIPAFQTPSAP